jgi:hypothetical protein
MSKRSSDLAIVASIWFFMAFISGAQTWTSLDTPDSEFHASMAIYGSEVTDRAATPVYYWTRLGFIAPAQALTTLFGPITGLEILRLGLLLIIVAAIYVTLKTFTSRFNASLLTLFIASNTVLLGYLGNPYPTTIISAGIFILIALLITGNSRWRELCAGGVIAWLAMTNPYGAILGVVVYFSLLIALPNKDNSLRSLGRRAVLGILGFSAVFGALWLVGRKLFPTLDWLSTYIYWNSALKQSDYIYDLYRWTWDPSLLVMPITAVIAWITWVKFRGVTQVRFAAVLATTIPVFALIYWKLFPSNYLEIPHYQALLWPTALMAMALAATAWLPKVPLTWQRAVVAIGSVAVVILAGHSLFDFEVWQSRLIALAAVIIFFLGRRHWSFILVGIAISFSLLQILQNSRDSLGVSSQNLYSNSFRENEVELMVTSSVQAQDFVLTQTQPGDRTLTWVDADWESGEQSLLPLAAFQLWGANEAEHGPTVTQDTIARWQGSKPLSIAMYGKSMDAVLRFWNSIPKENLPTIPQCTEVSWTTPAVANVCVTRLTWKGNEQSGQ